jgi:MinD-like ATPase involved in chromosome partitioning or flagellar assembly
MALQAGADAHAVKPFTGKELVKDIKRLIAEKPPMGAPMGQQVLVLRLEEGAGATTVATNLALSLAKGRHLTVIIDMVLEGGQVGQRMRLPETSSGLDLWEAGVDADDLAARLMRHDSGLFVLPTSPRSQGLRPDPRMAAQLLVRLQSWYDYLVVDTPRDLGVLTRILLRTSGLVLLLLTPDAEALRSAQTSLAAIRRLDSPSLRIWPVLNMLNSDQRAFQKEVEEMLGLPVAAVLPWSPEECTQAAESGRPVVLSFPESSLAREFDALGQQIVQTVSAP